MSRVKNLLNYLLCIGAVVAFTYYFDGRAGVTLLTMLLLVPFISFTFLIIAYYLSKDGKLSVTLKSNESVVNKGTDFNAELIIENKTHPIAGVMLEVEFATSQRISSKLCGVVRVAFCGNKKVVTIPCHADFCGLSSLKITKVKIVDFLGLASLMPIATPVKAVVSEQNIRVLPKIPDRIFESEMLRQQFDNASVSEDCDSETGETTYISSGSAGYEHRPYVPGDPLKKVNWKLSSKRSSLMVRLDEKLSTAGQALVLCCCDEKGTSAESIDICASALLATLIQSVSGGLSSTCFLNRNGSWVSIEVSDGEGIERVQQTIAECSFTDGFAGIPLDELSASSCKASLVFISPCTHSLDDFTREALSRDIGLFFVTPTLSSGAFGGDNVWTVNSQMEISHT